MDAGDPRFRGIFVLTGAVSAVAFAVLALGAFFFFKQREHPIGIILMVGGFAVAAIVEMWAFLRVRRIARGGRTPTPDGDPFSWRAPR